MDSATVSDGKIAEFELLPRVRFVIVIEKHDPRQSRHGYVRYSRYPIGSPICDNSGAVGHLLAQSGRTKFGDDLGRFSTRHQCLGLSDTKLEGTTGFVHRLGSLHFRPQGLGGSLKGCLQSRLSEQKPSGEQGQRDDDGPVGDDADSRGSCHRYSPRLEFINSMSNERSSFFVPYRNPKQIHFHSASIRANGEVESIP
jgi:hypothetical protein